MQLSYDTIRAIIEPIIDADGGDYCHEYGEPGYNFRHGAETPIVIMANYWCRCGKNPHAGKPRGGYDGKLTEPTDLHSFSDHHPRIWQQMEDQGVEFEWNDEWWTDYEAGKCYRTEANSYCWQSSIQWNEDMCDYMTPDTDLDTWIEWAVNDPSRCLMDRYRHQLSDAGFVQWEPHNPHRYESGWHEGMDDDPKAVTDEIRRYQPDDDIVFVLDETSQFYVGFSAWTRTEEDA